MKSKKSVAELEEMCCSVMRWGGGEEVVAYLDWDDRKFYLWFEVIDNFEDFCRKESGLEDLIAAIKTELEEIGVQEFYDIESANEFCKEHCGDNEPAFFYLNDWGVIEGA